MTQVKPQFNRGGEGAVAAAEASGFSKLHYLSEHLKNPGDRVVIRMLTDSVGDDAWIYVKQHGGVVTKNAPAGHTGNWPKSMPAICRYDSAFAGMYHDCAIDVLQLPDERGNYKKPSVRVWALACVRKPVIATQEMIDARKGTDKEIPQAMLGQRVGYTDSQRDVEETDDQGQPTGKKSKELEIVVVNQGVKNFFGYLQGLASYHGTICDRDLAIERTGEGLKTDFRVVPLDPTPTLTPQTESWKRYEKAIEDQGINLIDILTERSSDEYFAKFFDTRVSAPEQSSGDSAQAPTPSAPPSDLDQDRLASLRAKVSGRKTAPAEDIPDYE